MKILYTPISTLVASLTPEQSAEILAAAGKESVLVVAKTPERQREEIVDADVLFGRVSPTSDCASRSAASSASCGSRRWASSASAAPGAPSPGAPSASA